MTEPTLIHVHPSALHKSPTNPRKHLGDLTSLIESVMVHGVIEPILARKLDGQSGDDSLEIVAGERRWTAATKAGRETVPVLLRELSDDEALDLQLAENIERADLSPLEEAEAYALRVERGQTVQHIAERIGRPPAYVAQRLKLTSLEPKARERLAKGELTLGVALLLARIPERKLQLEALDEVTGGEYRKPLTAPQASKFIEERYMLRLAGAGFDRADANLVPGAGPCTTCPRRTGNQVELFADVKSPDLCTDPKCFRSKLDALWKLRQQEAKTAGQVIAGSKELEQAHEYGTGKLIRLDAEKWDGKKTRTVRAILGKECPKSPVLAQDPKTGHVVELVPRELLAKATAGSKGAVDGSRRRQAEAKKLKLQRQIDDAVEIRALSLAVRNLPKVKPENLIPFVTAGFVRAAGFEVRGFVAERRGLIASRKKDDAETALLEYVPKLSTSEALGLCFEMALATDRFDESRAEGFKLAGVDFAKLEKEVEREFAEKAKSKPKAVAKPKPAAKKPATKNARKR